MKSYLTEATLTLAMVVIAAHASAAALQFTIDPAQSSLTIAPTTTLFGAFSFPSNPQGDGSYTASYSGTIDAEVTATTIQLLASNLVAGISGAWKPGDNISDYPGAAYTDAAVDANYGIFTDFSAGAQFGLPASSLTAIRDLAFSFSDTAPKPLAGGSFVEVGTETDVTSGTAYYSVGAPPPITDLTIPEVASSALADVAGTGTLTKSGGVYTLTIPVSFVVSYNAFLDIATTYSGTIVATAVPEPASATMFAALLAIGACCTRRR